MAFFYVGQCENRGNHKVAKIGQTGRKYISERMYELKRKGDELSNIRYIQIDGTGVDAEFIEAEVRARLARNSNYTHTQHDHFLLHNTQDAYTNFIAEAMYYAIKHCEREGIKYTIKG